VAKATITIRQALTGLSAEHRVWLQTNQDLFNQVASFYFDVIQAHQGVLALSDQEALTALEKLTHQTKQNPNPIWPIKDTIPVELTSGFRRAAINVALGMARSFFSNLARWHKQKERFLAKAEAKAKRKAKKPVDRGKPQFKIRPPVPPRKFNRSVTLYASMYKDRTDNTIMLKVWTGKDWAWIKMRLRGRDIPEGFKPESPQLVRHGNNWWLHTPTTKAFKSPPKVEEQVTGNSDTKICAIDLNLGENIAVGTIQTVEGTVLATRFFKGGRRVNGFRKKQLGRVARNRHRTGKIAKEQQDNAALWDKLNNRNDYESHRISRRIVQFAQKHGATVIVFEHLGNLRPTKGKYSHRGNTKRAYWMKGRIFEYAKYKAFEKGILTSRVNPRNTSKECSHCHHIPIVRYSEGQPRTGYQMGAALGYCPQCHLNSNADRDASITIGQRLILRYKTEKPSLVRVRSHGQSSKGEGVAILQEPKAQGTRPSSGSARHEDSNGRNGTAQGQCSGMAEPVRDIPHQLRFQWDCA
jgi:putative transposase